MRRAVCHMTENSIFFSVTFKSNVKPVFLSLVSRPHGENQFSPKKHGNAPSFHFHDGLHGGVESGNLATELHE